jgi:hypothetical protein
MRNLKTTARGSAVASRVAQLQSKRFDGFAYFALGYVPPNPDFDIHKVNAMAKQHYGYEPFGYAVYHSEPGTAEMIESHVRSIYTELISIHSLFIVGLLPITSFPFEPESVEDRFRSQWCPSEVARAGPEESSAILCVTGGEGEDYKSFARTRGRHQSAVALVQYHPVGTQGQRGRMSAKFACIILLSKLI